MDSPFDDVSVFDNQKLELGDGTLVLIRNNGYLWGRHPDTMEKIRAWIFDGGPEVPESDYYLCAHSTFEVSKGPHDWLTRYVIVGIGRRKEKAILFVIMRCSGRLA